MNDVFVDASFFIAAIDPRDQHAPPARNAFRQLDRVWLHTTQEVLSEVLAFFCRRPYLRREALHYVDSILADPAFVIHPQSEASFEAAIALYRERPDKGYSLCDCRSMVLMQELEIEGVLSHDNHFTQEGFKKLY